MSKSDKTLKGKDFSLWCNEKNHKFPADTFSRVSKKCASLVHANDFQGTINHPVSEDTFLAFSLACQLKPFKVSITNAFELLELAQEWGIQSLETFVNNYITQKNLKRKEEDDHLGKLLAHLQDDGDVSRDIAGVARNFNEYLRDERLCKVHPEHLFKILMQAEQRHINQQLLIDFVMKMFQNEPEKAVPLCLRIDFDRLTNEQLEEVFQCREIHEQAMGYFIAEALSAIRNKAQNDLTDNEQRYIKNIHEIRDYIVKHRTVALAKAQEAFEAETKELDDLVKKQQKQINDLRKIRDEQREAAAAEKKIYDLQMDKFERELARQNDLIEQREKKEEQRREHIKEEVDDQMVAVRNVVDQKCAEIESTDTHRREISKQAVDERRDRFLQVHDDAKNLLNNLDLQIQHIHDRINETYATLAAKIVHDQLRFNNFLRECDNKFELFNEEPRIWELSADNVIEADKLIARIEQKVQKSCPINVNHEIKSSAVAINKFAELLSGGKKF